MRLNPYDLQFEPVFMGGQDRRPRQRMTGGNQPPIQMPYAGNFPSGNTPTQQPPWMQQITGGVLPPMQRQGMPANGGFAPMLQQYATGGNAPQFDNGRSAMMGAPAPGQGFSGNLWRFGNFGRLGYR